MPDASTALVDQRRAWNAGQAPPGEWAHALTKEEWLALPPSTGPLSISPRSGGNLCGGWARPEPSRTNRCAAVTRGGSTCRSWERPGERFCHAHRGQANGPCAGKTATGDECPGWARPGELTCRVHRNQNPEPRPLLTEADREEIRLRLEAWQRMWARRETELRRR